MSSPPADRLDALALRLVVPLDALRTASLRAFGRPLAPLIAQPDLRHAVFGSASILAAFALTCCAPLMLLAVGPFVLGVPHLMADVRYLVLRRGLLPARAIVALMFAALFAAGYASSVALAGAALLWVSVAARGAPRRRLAVACVAGLLLALDAQLGVTAAIALAHLHNLVALALWWRLRPARDRHAAAAPLLAAMGAAALAAGLLDTQISLLHDSGADRLFSLPVLARILSPVDDPVVSARFVLAFAFGQAVHYVVWLRLIPDDLRGRRAPRSFSGSYRALRHELGAPLLVGALATWSVLIAWAWVDAEAAWCAYLRLATFHGPLELACIGLAYAERRAL